MAKGPNGTRRAYGPADMGAAWSATGPKTSAIYHFGREVESSAPKRPRQRRMPEGLTEYEKKIWRRSNGRLFDLLFITDDIPKL